MNVAVSGRSRSGSRNFRVDLKKFQALKAALDSEIDSTDFFLLMQFGAGGRNYSAEHARLSHP
jgi:hypothetical protein